MGRISKRDQVLDTAEKLFVRNGYKATGISQITKEADVATMTLYNNFKNKDELVVAMLERRARQFMDLFESEIAKTSADPYDQILALFDVTDKWVQSESKTEDGFSGCAFVKASLEFNEESSVVRAAALIQKQNMLALFERLLKKAGYKRAKEKALELQLLFDGGIVQAQVLANNKSVKRARSMAERLLEYE